MVIRKKKKMLKFRGHRTYGYGSHKSHRGSGSRGGKGKAGGHKHKWSHTVKYDPDRYGKHGFTSKTRKNVNAINVSMLEKLAAGKKNIDLAKLGYNKVLGNGALNVAFEVTAEMFSKKAIEKIEAAGGKVIVLEKVKAGKSETETPGVEEKIEEIGE